MGRSSAVTLPYTSAEPDGEHPLDAGLPGRPQHVQRALGVGPERRLRRLPGAPDVARAGQVVHDLGRAATEQVQQGRRIEDVESVDGTVGGDDLVAGSLEVALQVVPHEPAGAGDQGPHAAHCVVIGSVLDGVHSCGV